MVDRSPVIRADHAWSWTNGGGQVKRRQAHAVLDWPQRYDVGREGQCGGPAMRGRAKVMLDTLPSDSSGPRPDPAMMLDKSTLPSNLNGPCGIESRVGVMGRPCGRPTRCSSRPTLPSDQCGLAQRPKETLAGRVVGSVWRVGCAGCGPAQAVLDWLGMTSNLCPLQAQVVGRWGEQAKQGPAHAMSRQSHLTQRPC